jgi:hypothetical protein
MADPPQQEAVGTAGTYQMMSVYTNKVFAQLRRFESAQNVSCREGAEV